MRVLVVAAHPDDETLGAGGTMAWHAARGDHVSVCILTDGVTSRHDRVELQAECARRACDTLGVKRLVLVGLPDQRLDTLCQLDVITPIESAIEEFEPEVVLTHFPGDVNEDHRIVSRATMVATRPQAGSSVRRVGVFEIPSSTDWAPPVLGSVFTPNLFVDVSETLDTKLAAMDAYTDAHVNEMRDFPHPRSVEGLTAYARRHGAVSGMLAAEPFMLLRESANRGLDGSQPGSTAVTTTRHAWMDRGVAAMALVGLAPVMVLIGGAVRLRPPPARSCSPRSASDRAGGPSASTSSAPWSTARTGRPPTSARAETRASPAWAGCCARATSTSCPSWSTSSRAT